MIPKSKSTVEERAVLSAERALASQKHVSAIDVLTHMDLLAPTAADNWRKGRVDYLEEVVQGSPNKIDTALATFHRWAKERGLTPSEARYVVEDRAGTRELRFTASGDPEAERVYRTQYISPELPERKKKKIEEASSKAPERVVFWILRDSKCTECGAELPEGSFLYMEGGQPLCLACSGLDDLEYLPSGDTALTRRASKYTARKAVVVRFSRSRGRYERQGILVEEPALAKAEEECTADAADRARHRELAAKQREVDDRQLVEKMAERIQKLFPNCPPREARAIASHTAVRGSGRVGRTAAGRALDEDALRMAAIAAIRHKMTDYDELLAAGLEREQARARVRDRVDEILDNWSS